MRSRSALDLIFFILFAAMLLSAGCVNQGKDNSEDNSDAGEMEIDWGIEIGLDETIAMAKEGRILEIQWHVMPNILRATTSDGTIYHLRNENKGVDLRSRLIEAGVRVGKDGLQFRHVFWDWEGPEG